jgi:hypothetical protein
MSISPSPSIARQLSGKCNLEPSGSPLSEAKHLHRLVQLNRMTAEDVRELVGYDNEYRRRVLAIFEHLLDPQKVCIAPPVVKEKVVEVARVRSPDDPLTPEEIAQAELALRNGTSWVKVRRLLGCSRSTLFRFVKFRKGKGKPKA